MIPTEWECPVELTRKQMEGLRFRAPMFAGRPQLETVAFLGEPGSGKTTGAAARFQDYCLATGSRSFIWKNGRKLTFTKREPPMSGIVGITASDVIDGPLKQLLRIINPKMIRKERLNPPHRHIDLINGHRIKLFSMKGALNGQNLCSIWADEIQGRIYAKKFNGGTYYSNIVNRVREDRAQRLGVVVSGHALSKTHVEAWFRHKDEETLKVILMLQRENARNLGGNIVRLRKSHARSEFDPDSDFWNQSHDTLWPWFGEDNILRGVPIEAFYGTPVRIGVDLGKHGAVIFGVPYRHPVTGLDCLLIVDEWMPDKLSASKIAAGVAEKFSRWKFAPEVSRVAIDPTIAGDEVDAFSAALGVPVIQFKNGPMFERKNGIRAVDIAVLNEADERRLLIHEDLIDKTERGTYAAVRSYDGVGRDNILEHSADALRYLVCMELGLPEMEYDLDVGVGGVEAA